MGWKDYQVDMPEGEKGNWSIRKFEVSEDAAGIERMRMFNPSTRGRGVSAGIYTGLYYRSRVIMSDTPDEIGDLYPLFHRVRGDTESILINGLGLGVALNAVMQKAPQAKVTCIEIDADVIDLVGSYWLSVYGERLTIIHADALTFKPPRGLRYNLAWHDIWPDICADNLDDMKLLHRKYGRRCNWQGSWCRDYIR